MNEMIDQVYNFMTQHQMVPRGGRILAAVSGGADSMCLLEVLQLLKERLGAEVRVLHVHHGLRDSAERDLRFVQAYCRDRGIPFRAERVDAAGYAAEKGLSLEEAARGLRYAALQKAAQEWDAEKSDGTACVIAVAHHLEDQAETVLFHLVRGSRLTGLQGMRPVNGRIIRPLLAVRRSDIEAFLAGRGTGWCEDESNEDTKYARNLLRREVMPLLETINARTCEHIARAAEEAAETEELLREETDRALRRCLRQSRGSAGERTKEGAGEPEIVIDIPALCALKPILARRVVYAAIAQAAGTKKDLQNVHVMDVLGLAKSKGNGRISLPGGAAAQKSYDELYIYTAAQHSQAAASRHSAPVSEALPDDGRWPLEAGAYRCKLLSFDGDMAAVPRNQYTKWFDYDKIGSFPIFRTRREGDRMTIEADGRSKSVARMMIDAKVPAGMRGKIVLPALGSEILWLPGGRISAAYMVEPSTARVLEITLEADTL